MQEPAETPKRYIKPLLWLVVGAVLVGGGFYYIHTYYKSMAKEYGQHKQQIQDFEQKLIDLRMQIDGASGQDKPVANTTQIKAAYLLAKTAAISLQNGRDIEMSKVLLQLAADHLQNLSDPKVLDALKIIANDQEKLNAIQMPDIRKVQENIVILDKLINVMPLHGTDTSKNVTESKTLASANAPKWYEYLSNMFSSLKNIIKVRKKNPSEISLAELDIARAQFKLIIEEIRWAAIYNNAQVYERGVHNAQVLLPQIFDMQSESAQKFAAVLQELQKTQLQTDIPNIDSSVNALHAILVG